MLPINEVPGKVGVEEQLNISVAGVSTLICTISNAEDQRCPVRRFTYSQSRCSHGFVPAK